MTIENMKRAWGKVLIKIKGYFSKLDRIERMLVVVGGNHRQWVKDPKKIKYWLDSAKLHTQTSASKGSIPPIQIKKVIYKP